jgi:hypothetical protein
LSMFSILFERCHTGSTLEVCIVRMGSATSE